MWTNPLSSFSVSINPTYYCNFNCDFCYLSTDQLNDRTTTSIDTIMQRLSEIPVPITHVDLYGGEIGLLPDTYLNELIDRIKLAHNPSISIITNLSAIRESFLRPDVELSVSYDFDAREKESVVFGNMLKLQRPFSVLTLASEKVIVNDVDYMISALNSLTNLIAVEIKPYSSTTHRGQQVSDCDYEEFIMKWIDSPVDKNWQFVNQDKIEDCLNDDYNAFSDDHVYIDPTGMFAILDFDAGGNEFFTQVNDFSEYIAWTNKEKSSGVSDVCRQCKYFGKCLTEHYKWVDPSDLGCNGYYNLLEWYNAPV